MHLPYCGKSPATKVGFLHVDAPAPPPGSHQTLPLHRDAPHLSPSLPSVELWVRSTLAARKLFTATCSLGFHTNAWEVVTVTPLETRFPRLQHPQHGHNL